MARKIRRFVLSLSGRMARWFFVDTVLVLPPNTHWLYWLRDEHRKLRPDEVLYAIPWNYMAFLYEPMRDIQYLDIWYKAMLKAVAHWAWRGFMRFRLQSPDFQEFIRKNVPDDTRIPAWMFFTNH